MNKPLVTIITSVYNHEKYLEEYIESIINQTYTNIELILIDDASQDNSTCVIEKWLPDLKRKFNNLIYIPRKVNKGLIFNCNEGLRLSKGEYIYLFASDDVMMPTNVEEKVDYLEKNPKFGFVYSDGFYIYEETIFKSKIKKIIKKKFSNTHHHFYGNIKKEIIQRNFIPAPTVLIRKECYKKVGKYSNKYFFEDYYMWIHIAQYYEVGYINKSLVRYRVHDQSLSGNTNNMGKNINSLMELYREIEKKGFYKKSEIEIANKNVYKFKALYAFSKRDKIGFNKYYKKARKDYLLRLKKAYINLKIL